MNIALFTKTMSDKWYSLKNIESCKEYYIMPEDKENYDENTKTFLYDFICSQNRFPLYITYEGYDRDPDLNYSKWGVPFQVVENTGLYDYPIYHLLIEDPESLFAVLNETFWIAASNQFYALSFSSFIPYEPGLIEISKRSSKSVMLPSMDLAVHTPLMVIFHDGWGFDFYTKDSFVWPEGTIVTKREE